MKATRLLLAAMVLGTAVGASQANAQGCSGNAGTCNTTNIASVTVGALVKLQMSSAATTLTPPTADNVDLGTTVDDLGPTFTVKSNRSWTLNIHSGRGAFWDFNGAAGTAKPIADLTWSNTNGSGYAPISTTDAIVKQGASATQSGAASVFFRTLYNGGLADPSNAPGLYSLPVVFTLTAP
jgi:hypothetical protein